LRVDRGSPHGQAEFREREEEEQQQQELLQEIVKVKSSKRLVQ
jgi:hypothetical protein